MRPAVLRLALLAGLAVIPAGRVARADTPARAEALFREGRASADAGDYAHACVELAESLRLEPAPGTLLNLADCEEHLGHLASARDHFLRVEGALPAADERRLIAHDRAAALSLRVPWLVITVSPDTPPDARVFRDGAELEAGRLGVPLPVDPGPHRVLVVATGRESATTAVVAPEGATVHVVASPGSVVAPPAVPAREPPRAAPAHTAAWLVGAAGIASLGVGAYFGGRALAERSLSDASCAGAVCGSAMGLGAYESARHDAVAADVALGVGIVALAVGGYLLLTGRGPSRTGAGLRLTGPGMRAAW